MKLQYKPVDQDSLSSIYVKRVRKPYLGGDWHFHEEYEIIYFIEGQGMRIVGDHISNFQKGELVLVGKGLPHVWRNEAGFSGEASADFIVVKFPTEFDSVNLFSLNELTEIRVLLKKCSRGILFSTTVVPTIHDVMLDLTRSESSEKLINFLRILNILAKEDQFQLLSSPDFSFSVQLTADKRLKNVINYISFNYNRTITLEEISSIAIMTPPAFCRFFKNRTNKTFSNFLNEFKIGKASQLLMNDEKSVGQICFDVGFNSLTNFNRTFKKFKGTTPSDYRNRYRAFQ